MYFESMFYLIWPLPADFPSICYSLAGPRAAHGRAFFKTSSAQVHIGAGPLGVLCGPCPGDQQGYRRPARALTLGFSEMADEFVAISRFQMAGW